MRICRVIGTVTLVSPHASMCGAALRLAVPLSLANLTGADPSTAEPIVVYDSLQAPEGCLIAVTEGGEATQPFRPELKPIDAYNSAILDHVDITAADL